MDDSYDCAPRATATSVASISTVSSRVVVRLPERAIVLPPTCACCGALATERVQVRDGAELALLVGYCSDCAVHVARANTRRLAAMLASMLVATSLAAGLPIVLPYLDVCVCIAITFGGGLLPLAALALSRRPANGHAATGPAAHFQGARELVCERREWIEPLVSRESLPVVTQKERVPTGLVVALGPVCLLAWVLAPLSHHHHHPRVHVVNGNDRTLEIQVDGRSLGRVEPSSTESPAAGLAVRVPSGRRVFRAIDPSAGVVAEAVADVLPGRDHLYAPGAPQLCFWLETTSYGRAGERVEREPLASPTRFWAVPPTARGWFVPSPPADEEARTTGGTSTVLRQGPCDQLPPDV